VHALTSPGPTSFDIVNLIVGAITAIGSIVAIIVAVIAIRGSHRSASTEQLFIAAGEMIAALQQIEREGGRLGQVEDGEQLSRDVISDPFSRFLAARARVDLAMRALGINGTYPDAVFTMAHNFAAGVLQADEFAGLHEEFIPGYLEEQSWGLELSWTPSEDDMHVLGRSASFTEVRQALSWVPDVSGALGGFDWWWGERILAPDSQQRRSVYWIDSAYMTQTSRLVGDFTREFVQPLLELALSEVGKRTIRAPKAVFVAERLVD
jgi:hypothetical protein